MGYTESKGTGYKEVGKSVKTAKMLLPFQGVGCFTYSTQGVALGYVLVGLSGRFLADNDVKILTFL